MRIQILTDLCGQPQTVPHDAPWIEDTTTEHGVLVVEEFDAEMRPLRTVKYARGHWLRLLVVGLPDDEVLRYRAALAERDRQASPPNGPRQFNATGGNSGPG